MSDEKMDRRVQRTRQLLRKALIELINEKGYDSLTIQDITDRANLGRTTFYLHYQSKAHLLLDHHAALLDMLKLDAWSREELLAEVVASGLVEFLERIALNRGFYMAIITAKEAEAINRGMQEQMVNNLHESISAALPERSSRMPLIIVCNYVVGAQLALIKWWMLNRNDYKPLQIAHMIQRLQYVAINDALKLS